jgi:type II secretory pathway pseudopilin PulG
MKKLSQNGFAVLEALLVIVIVGAIAGTGLYVWHSQKEADKALKASNTAANSNAEVENPSSTDETANWLLYTAPSKSFSMRLADGWSLNRFADEDSLYGFGAVSATYAKGKQAKVTVSEGGSDGTTVGLFINYFARSEDASGKLEGEKQAGLKTKQGVSVSVYKFVQTEEVDGLGGTPTGATVYSYVGSKDDARFVITYGVDKDSADQHQIVEKAIGTFQFK